MLNQCILTGNLGDDPSSHYTPEGLAVSHFNIAFKSSHKKKDPNWIKVSCFGKLAEVASPTSIRAPELLWLESSIKTNGKEMMDRPEAPSRSSPILSNLSRLMDEDSGMGKHLPMTKSLFR